MSEPCPCGSGTDYAACCGPWHAGGSAPTAEALMRSRYCAFVKRDIPYLMRTSHPVLRGKTSAKDLQNSFKLGWKGLEIVETSAGGPDDQEGMVRFRATFATGVHDERSRFSRVDGAWVYRDGKVTPQA